jgi:hypothetical protein
MCCLVISIFRIISTHVCTHKFTCHMVMYFLYLRTNKQTEKIQEKTKCRKSVEERNTNSVSTQKVCCVAKCSVAAKIPQLTNVSVANRGARVL